jgi:hypothetical protein
MSDAFKRNSPTLVLILLVILSLAGCATISPYTDRAVAERKAMNDSQAHLAILGMCDVAIGAAMRSWSEDELALAFLICNPTRIAVPMPRLAAPESVP